MPGLPLLVFRHTLYHCSISGAKVISRMRIRASLAASVGWHWAVDRWLRVRVPSSLFKQDKDLRGVCAAAPLSGERVAENENPRF